MLVLLELVLAAGLGVLLWQSLNKEPEQQGGATEQAVQTESTQAPSKTVILAELENGIDLPLANVAPRVELSETLERPLFQPGRRPPPPPKVDTEPPDPVVQPEPPPPPEPPEFTLEAVVLAGDMRAALLGTGDGSTRRVGEGGAIDGWVLAAIEPHRVTLQKGEVTHPLELRRFEAAPPNPARQAARRRAPSAADRRAGRGRNDAQTPQRGNRANNRQRTRNSAAERAVRSTVRRNARATRNSRARPVER